MARLQSLQPGPHAYASYTLNLQAADQRRV